jgi:hypothetical protein
MKNIILMFILFSSFLSADELPVYTLRLKNHKFIPEMIKVKANQKFKLIVVNEDNTFEEFESNKMVVEKFINPKGKLNLTLGPYKVGDYDFFGEFHMSTAKGILRAE